MVLSTCTDTTHSAWARGGGLLSYLARFITSGIPFTTKQSDRHFHSLACHLLALGTQFVYVCVCVWGVCFSKFK